MVGNPTLDLVRYPIFTHSGNPIAVLEQLCKGYGREPAGLHARFVFYLINHYAAALQGALSQPPPASRVKELQALIERACSGRLF